MPHPAFVTTEQITFGGTRLFVEADDHLALRSGGGGNNSFRRQEQAEQQKKEHNRDAAFWLLHGPSTFMQKR